MAVQLEYVVTAPLESVIEFICCFDVWLKLEKIKPFPPHFAGEV